MDSYHRIDRGSTHRRPDKGRAKRARALVTQLMAEVSPRSPARPTVQELHRLFYPAPPKDIRRILARIPGETDAERAETIGISKQWFSELWNRKYPPTPELAERIAALAGVPREEVLP